MQQLIDSPEVFRGRDRGVRWSRISYGLYVARRTRRELTQELQAWSLVLPAEAGFTHLTSAELRGWWLPEPVPHPVFAALLDGASAPRRAGLMATRHRNLPATELVQGVRVTTGAETLLAAARDLSVLDLVLMGDSALRLAHTSLKELARAAAQRRRGGPMLRTVIPLLDKRSESPYESAMRVLHAAADIEVEPQHKVFDDTGRFVARADLWLVGTRRVHEYDGADHRSRETHRHDLSRDRRLIHSGWERLGFSSPDLLHGGEAIIRSADQVLNRAWDGRRLTRWNALVSASLFSPAGRRRALARWGMAGPPQTPR